MSTTSKCVLAGTIAISGSIILYVHFKQSWDRELLRGGVILDQNRQEQRRRNADMMQYQTVLRQALESQPSDGQETHKPS